MALAHKQVEVETVPVGFTAIAEIENGGQTSVPVIRHGEKVIADSFKIALYLRDAYPDRGDPLFRGEGSIPLARFVEAWSQSQLHSWIIQWSAVDIHAMLNAADQAHFRAKREKQFGRTMEEVVADREGRAGQLRQILTPIRMMLAHQPYLGGSQPAFADYIPFGALQWLRICSGLAMWDRDDPVRDWFERLLDLHGGLARRMCFSWPFST